MTRATLLSVLRHGTVAGRPDVFRGRSDPELDTDGRAQMWGSAQSLDDPAWFRVMTSPRRRCHDFAAEQARNRGIPLDVDPRWAEIDFGAWEELTPKEALARDGAACQVFLDHPEKHRPPQGESFTEFHTRVLAAFDSLPVGEAGHYLLVTHAGVMRVILSHVLGLTFRSARAIALAPAAHFRLSLLPGHAPILLSLHGEGRCMD